MNFVYFHLNIA